MTITNPIIRTHAESHGHACARNEENCNSVYAEHIVSIVNKTTIVTRGDADAGGTYAWVREGGYSGEKTFRPGETVYILPPYHTADLLQPGVSTTYQFDNEAKDQIGRTFWLEFADETGRVFAKTEVVITA